MLKGSTPILFALVKALPQARTWALKSVADHAAGSIAATELGFHRLEQVASGALLRRVRVAVVNQVPRPPFEEWNLHGADDFVGFDAAGIALMRTVFIRSDRCSDESLVFHELVHVLQWESLGINRFLGVYGVQLLEHGYSDSPLELMAYDLQRKFDEGRLTGDLIPIVQRRTQELLADFRRCSWKHRLAAVALSLAPGRMPMPT